MWQIGITGGIGSGKSTVAAIFEVLGIPVLKSDEVAKMLMNNDAALKQNIINHFGEAVYVNGILDRKHLASLVFDNTEKLQLLNSLVHPATLKYSQHWAQSQSAPYVIREAALIFESGSFKDLDKVIGVYAPEVIRIQRVLKRDDSNISDIQKRIKQQMNEEEKMKLCDYVIDNSGSKALLPQVLKLHSHLLELFSK